MAGEQMQDELDEFHLREAAALALVSQGDDLERKEDILRELINCWRAVTRCRNILDNAFREKLAKAIRAALIDGSVSIPPQLLLQLTLHPTTRSRGRPKTDVERRARVVALFHFMRANRNVQEIKRLIASTKGADPREQAANLAMERAVESWPGTRYAASTIIKEASTREGKAIRVKMQLYLSR
jgi:hypothetical protein